MCRSFSFNSVPRINITPQQYVAMNLISRALLSFSECFGMAHKMATDRYQDRRIRMAQDVLVFDSESERRSTSTEIYCNGSNISGIFLPLP